MDSLAVNRLIFVGEIVICDRPVVGLIAAFTDDPMSMRYGDKSLSTIRPGLDIEHIVVNGIFGSEALKLVKVGSDPLYGFYFSWLAAI